MRSSGANHYTAGQREAFKHAAGAPAAPRAEPDPFVAAPMAEALLEARWPIRPPAQDWVGLLGADLSICLPASTRRRGASASLPGCGRLVGY